MKKFIVQSSQEVIKTYNVEASSLKEAEELVLMEGTESAQVREIDYDEGDLLIVWSEEDTRGE